MTHILMHSTSPEIQTYRTLRYYLGFLGITLSIILYFGNWFLFDNTGLENSISKYYYSPMRDAFVGYLVAIGLFLMSYNGYYTNEENQIVSDNIAGKVAGVFAITTAVFPTVANGIHITKWTNNVHFISAFILYVLLGYFCFSLFRRGRSQKDEMDLIAHEIKLAKIDATEAEPFTEEKAKKITELTRSRLDEERIFKETRNKIYKYSGLSIWACVILITFFSFTELHEGWWDSSTFWLETIANVSFGIAWFVKGGAFSFKLNPTEWREKSDWEMRMIKTFETAFVIVLGILYPVMILHVLFW